MGKPLNERSLEELWQLFPISLVSHRQEWKTWYECEAAAIRSLVPEKTAMRLSHIGSTAVANLWAKNIVDLLLEVEDRGNMLTVSDILLDHGWLCMDRKQHRISLNKGYTESGFADRVFHLHLRLWGDNDELYFRDYLRENPAVAEEYERRKLALAETFRYHRDGYTAAKSEFVKMYTDIARKEYGQRY